MKIALYQMQAVPGDVAANLDKIEKAAREAASKGAELLVAPELALTGYGAGKAIPANAEPTDGAQAGRLEKIAAETGVAVLAGFAEREGDHLHNSAIYCDGEGVPLVYRKCNLYGDYERALFKQGAPDAVRFTRGGLSFGVLICYDVEFPENVRRLARAGVDVVLVPTALPAGEQDRFIARSMVPVRAFENQIFVAYADHCGRDENFTYAGLSCVAAPDGSLIAAAERHGEALLVAEIEPGRYEASAAVNTYLADLNI